MAQSQIRRKYHVLAHDGPGHVVEVRGREAWALDELIKAAGKGCTPIDNPAPRWSSYVHKLRTIYNLNVETISEPHGGAFAGSHARYVLRSKVAPVSDREVAA